MKNNVFFQIIKFIFTMYIILSPVNYAAGETITFKADSMQGYAKTDDSSKSSSDYAKLIGNANITTESNEIFADVIEMSGEKYRYIKANGNVTGTNTKNKIDFSSNEFYYDRVNKISTMQDSVRLIDRENEAIANAELMEYNENDNCVVMQISVTIQQKDSICKGAYAIYNMDTRMLFLSGNPQITQGKDVFRAQEIMLNLDTQEVTLDGRVRGSVTSTNKN